MNHLALVILIIFSFACDSESIHNQTNTNNNLPNQQETGSTITTRFLPPAGFETQKSDSLSFDFFLQHLTLKPAKEEVTYFNGAKKPNAGVYHAVVDLPIGNRDLHQCADAVIRLRADYLKSIDKENEIAFHFTNGFNCDYKTWKSGKRPSVNGNTVTWVNGNKHSQDYWKYLEMVFSYAGTLSLDKELKTKSIDAIEIGDVFIQGGSPGHAVIVVNLAENSEGEKRFMLAQSYMPAQEIQILNNPKTNSVWYEIPENIRLMTPEWTFSTTDLKSF